MSEDKQIKENLSLTSPTIYEIISKEGEEELERPPSSLLFSGIVAGLCISFSLYAMGYLSLLTDNQAIIALGYTIGFLMVSKGRFQLFTENTITAILPTLNRKSKNDFLGTARLWGIVFMANMIGTAVSAFLMGPVGVASPDQLAAFIEISKEMVIKSPASIFLTAIPAGFILATMVWMLPSTKDSKTIVVLLMTYVISIGHFSHVVAGSAEVFLLLFSGKISFIFALKYIFLAGLGNIVGGTVIFSLLAYAQTYKEL